MIIITCFNTRSSAREFAKNNGMNTSAVIDYSKTVKNVGIGKRWAVKTVSQQITLTRRSETTVVVSTGDGYHKRKRTVDVTTRKVRKVILPIAA